VVHIITWYTVESKEHEIETETESVIHRYFEGSKGDRVDVPRQTVHRIAHLSEHPHAARPSLHMLAESAERFELDTAVRLWAPVYLLVVERALQVLIEAGEGAEFVVA
jgi:hypothetical protein